MPVPAPASRTLDPSGAARVRKLFAGTGLDLLTPAKNPWIAVEVRTAGRSIFTLYTSGKLVSTVREGDAEGLDLEQQVAAAVGGSVAARPKADRAPPARGRSADTVWLAGADETGTGEVLGSAIVGGALLPVELSDTVHAVAGHVETKGSRTNGGWERLGARLSSLAEDGLVLAALPVPNRLFDRYRKNALLDLTYVRLVGDLIAAAPLPPDDGLEGVELALDDYGCGPRLHDAVATWRARGARALVETKADDRHLAARVASVFARSERAREMEGIAADAADGPVGTGNSGDRQTKSWLRAHVRSGAPWPRFVKCSFKTVTALRGLPETIKESVPGPGELLDDEGAARFLAGRLDVRTARFASRGARPARKLVVDGSGALIRPKGAARAHEFLPLLFGGLVLDESVWDLDTLLPLLERDGGLLSGWRVLLGARPEDDDDPVLVALMRAHRAGIVHLVATGIDDPIERAVRRAGLLLGTRDRAPVLLLQLRP